jgi:hypothetical protein
MNNITKLDIAINEHNKTLKKCLADLLKVAKSIPRYREDKSRYCTIELYGTEMEVNYNFIAGRPVKMYLANGDPGHPEDPTEIEILSIKCEDLCCVFDMMDQPEKASKLVEKLYSEIEEEILKLESKYENY